MDAAKKKELFRAKLNAQKKDKRLDSPLVRYNEFDQPVCRVCNVVLKSESLWEAHQASRKHHEAINNLKANASGRTNATNSTSQARTEATPKQALKEDLRDTKLEPAKSLPKPQSASALPTDFFDNHQAKKQKVGSSSPDEMEGLPNRSNEQASDVEIGRGFMHSRSDSTSVETKQTKGALPEGFFDNKETEHARSQTQVTGAETKQVKGALPAGFFDNKEADLRARGIKPVKPDVKDEYKEFEKLIQEDLKEVDNRMEEEEVDAAEMIEEAESVEQKTYREKVELLRKKRTELMAARSVKRDRDTGSTGKESIHEESSSDSDGDENFAVDWRAQHL